MRIRVRHETVYTYDQPPNYVIQSLRLTPRNHDGQLVRDWRIELDRDVHLNESRDGLGNIVHTFSLDGPLTELTVGVEGTVDTLDTAGVVAGAVEPFPPDLFLRETPLTKPDDAIIAFAEDAAAATGDAPLETLHALLTDLHTAMRFDTGGTDATTTAAEAFEHRHGVCQDFAHIFVAAARRLGRPARYVSGYLRRNDGVDDQEAGHAWAEAHVPDLGWVGFDAVHGTSVTDHYVRVATGLDYLGAAPIRGTRYGGHAEDLTVRITVDQARRGSQQ